MSMINEKDFKELANYKNEICVSIFIPTQRAGKEVLEGKNKKHLHSKWVQIRKELKEQNVQENVINNIAKPIENLLENRDFWRHQSDGLAIFASEDYFQNYTLPVNFDDYHYISEEFYVKPLVHAMTGDGKFNILAIQLEDVKLFEASKYSIAPVEIEDLTPSRLEERVGFDYKEKALQFRTQGEGGEKTQFHGHGGSERDEKTEIKQFFRAVDQGLKEYLNREKLPLVVYCQDYMFPIYKDANTYNHLVDAVIPGNPNDSDLMGIHQKAIEVMEPFLNDTRDEKIEKYKELSSTENTTSAISDIIAAVHQGKVDTLFIENRAEVWGDYNEENMKVEFAENNENGSTSLLNLAAKKTIEMGGKVYLVEHEFMPQKKSKMNALLRF
ncbi:hypothetical protein [Christiangramia sabulilitoris]|uniref:Uncharacterized protein n=1 Tax=Christiangramia sabulilitoris TaxID=2583991 RepID=A0A550I5Z3_9FLAO|nr:hypothetical protein [Christiangramia sabulilitoris]TRO66386.1 hypothetical protein FGM01_00435 [Christiangramia sabulilitoris]